MNDQYVKHVGYVDTNAAISAFFSLDTAKFLQRKIQELLSDYFSQGVVVALDKIIALMNSVYEAYRPSTGDIYGRYTIPSAENYNCVDEMINQVIQIAVTRIRTDLETEQNNSKLDVWNSVYGSFNEHGLRAHPVIKTRERRPRPMLFNMNY